MDVELIDATAGPPERAKWTPVLGEWTGLRLPRTVRSRWAVTLPNSGELDVALHCRLEGDGFGVSSLRVNRKMGSSPLTGEVLRALALQSWTEKAARKAVDWPDESGAASGAADTAWLRGHLERQGLRRELWPLPSEKGQRGGPSETTVALAVAVYRYLDALGQPPHAGVQRAFDLSPAGASNWIQTGRASGLFESWAATIDLAGSSDGRG